jgi:crossover junction endodeoxyribonuclease RuvC
VRVFGIDPGSVRTGYGCVESDGRRHRLIEAGAIATETRTGFPDKLLTVHTELARHLAACRPDCVAIESVFYAANARSALRLGHVRGVAILAAVQGGYPVVEYAPAEIKRALVGYGRAEKHQVGEMVRLLLGLVDIPSPHDAADALAVAICHLHSRTPVPDAAVAALSAGSRAKQGGHRSWRNFEPPRESGPATRRTRR